jgi:hypothetical protein
VSSAAAKVDAGLARIAALNPRFRAFASVDAEGAVAGRRNRRRRG